MRASSQALAIVLAVGASQLTTTTIAGTATRSEEPSVVADALDTVRDELRDELLDAGVRLQRGLRDAVDAARDRLAVVAYLLDEQPDLRIPELGVLRVEPVEGASSSGFGWRRDPIRNHRKFHKGADLRGRHGTPVRAAGDGVVTFCGRQGGYGKVIYVDHGGGVVTRYAHLRRIETKKHATVVAGERIGQVGATGRATGPHLHFEVRLDGRPVDPVTALAVAELSRVSPAEGRIAAYALAPELQRRKLSDIDPPSRAKARKARSKDTGRPERRGRTRRVKPLS